jgi:hypothetical protein
MRDTRCVLAICVLAILAILAMHATSVIEAGGDNATASQLLPVRNRRRPVNRSDAPSRYSVLGAKSRSVQMHAEPRAGRLDRAAILLVGATLVISTPDAVNADQQGASPARDARVQQNGGESGSDYNGEDFTRPESKFETRFEGVTSGTTTQIDRETLLLRTQIPVVNKDTMAPNPANSTHDFGIGDAAFQGVLTQPINERWGYGFGARLVSPTAQDSLGSGKWQIMPGFGIRYSFFKLALIPTLYPRFATR